MRTPRNPDLPIIDELRAEMRERMIDAELRELRVDIARPRRSAPTPPAPNPSRLEFTGRVTRRSVVLVALLCLLAGVAFAQFGTEGGPPAHTRPDLLGESMGAAVSAYRDEDRLCLLVDAGAPAPSAECGFDLADAGLRVTSVLVAGRRFVAGISGRDVQAVQVAVDGHRRRVATHPPLDPEGAAVAGVPAGVRWFAASVGVGVGRAPARLLALGHRGRRIGAVILDCSLRIVGRPCRRAYARRGTDRLR